MILYELLGTENHQVYQDLEISNGTRQYDFLRSLVETALVMNRKFLSSCIIKALNHHAIACLHVNAGEYRPCQVTVGSHTPPEYWRVTAQMDDFVNYVNSIWEATDAGVLATLVLWRLNYIHPFINGNGRTARAACYFVLCVKAGRWLPGIPILPELLKRDRADYVAAHQKADAAFQAGALDVTDLHDLLRKLLLEQLNSAPAAEPPPPPVRRMNRRILQARQRATT